VDFFGNIKSGFKKRGAAKAKPAAAAPKEKKAEAPTEEAAEDKPAVKRGAEVKPLRGNANKSRRKRKPKVAGQTPGSPDASGSPKRGRKGGGSDDGPADGGGGGGDSGGGGGGGGGGDAS
jgi:hypothetical protein